MPLNFHPPPQSLQKTYVVATKPCSITCCCITKATPMPRSVARHPLSDMSQFCAAGIQGARGRLILWLPVVWTESLPGTQLG